MSTSTTIRDYFHREAADYDAYFAKRQRQPRSIGRWLAKHIVSPKAPERRLDAVLGLCGDVSGLRVLEVGCGPGQYSLELAKRGAHVVGIDFAPAMIDLARQRLAGAGGLAGNCEFVAADGLDYEKDGDPFDLVVAAGVFDYVAANERSALLRRMRSNARQAVIVSFPKRWHHHAWLRKAWLGAKRVPVWFYTRGEVSRWLDTAGLRQVETRDIGILRVVKARPSDAN